MTCKAVQNQVSSFLDSELSGSEMLEIRSHLSRCANCREEIEAVRSLKLMLSSCPVPEPPADLADRLCASVLAHHGPAGKATFRFTSRKSVLTFAGVAICSMAITVVVLSNIRSSAERAEGGVAATKVEQDLAFDVQRNQVYAAGLDATSGVPVMTNPSDGSRP